MVKMNIKIVIIKKVKYIYNMTMCHALYTCYTNKAPTFQAGNVF